MIVYTIYYFGENEDVHFIGFLPERRKNPERITQESILNFVTTILGHEVNDNKIFFFQVTLDERIGEILWPKPAIRTQETI
jgi:hypothetical protein